MNISPAIQKAFAKSTFQLQKYSPQILTGIGIAGLLTAGVLAAKNTLKLTETVSDAKFRLDNVTEAKEDGTATQQDVNRVVVKNSVELAKLYWFPITLAGASTVSILVGHRILHQRNLALVAAYKGLEQFISDYRKRVIEEHGEEADRKYALGISDHEETVNGKKVKSEVIADTHGGYVYEFGPSNENFSGQLQHNLFFLETFQNVFNDRLKVYEHVFLNDVLRALGFEDDRRGAVTGWTFKKGVGDDYISFGIRPVNDIHGTIMLDFNVDGVILDYLDN